MLEDNREMTDLSISIPETMLHWLEQRAAAGDFVDAGDLVRDLVRREQDRTRRNEWLREQIAEGEASGFVEGRPEDLIEEIIAARKARHG
jgi:antitoxin ParD1/3/4